MDKKKSYPKFPLFLDISEWEVLVIGGGKIAERRIGSLLKFGPKIRCISPELTENIRQWVEDGKLGFTCREALAEDILAFCQERAEDRALKQSMILACSADDHLNREAARIGRLKGLWVNNASCQEESDFFFPAIMEKDSLILGLTSDGRDHGRVRKAAAAVREFLNNTDM